jgi:hypothetical protein
MEAAMSKPKKNEKKRDRRTKQIILEAEAPGAARLAVAPFDMERLAWLNIRFEYWRDSPVRRPTFEGMDAAELEEQKRLQTLLWLVEDWPVKRLDYLDDRLTIEIDFSKVNSPDALKEQVTNLIDVCWFAYAQKTGHKTLKRKDHELILKVGRYKEANPDMSYLEIGKIFFPKEEKARTYAKGSDNPYAYPDKLGDLEESGAKQAENKHKDYLHYIKGGWQKLRYP